LPLTLAGLAALVLAALARPAPVGGRQPLSP
jgi:hypothetical protein